jgi:nitrilase
MSETVDEVTVAAVQAAPVFLDRSQTVEKACARIAEAGADGADVVVFPEGFVPGHPLWYHFHGVSTDLSRTLATRLFENAVEVPGPATDRLGAAAAEAGTLAVVGVCEREPGTVGTLYNSQLVFSPTGELLDRHQKLTPTLGERLVHARGRAEHFGATETPYGTMSSMICSENANPLAAYALLSEYPRLHAMSWPSYFAGMRETVGDISRLYAQMSKSHVVSAASVVSDRALEVMNCSGRAETIRAPENTGGSVILGPGRETLAGPLGTDEGMLLADVDLAAMVPRKLTQDYAGHYNRPDIFEFSRTGTVDSAATQTGGARDRAGADDTGDPGSVAGTDDGGDAGTTGATGPDGSSDDRESSE